MMKAIDLLDPRFSYAATDDNGVFSLIDLIRKGIRFASFLNFASRSPFTLGEWCGFLHVSERTMQRYQKDKRTFDSLQSEKIIEIALLYRKGGEVFGNQQKFDSWLDTENVALGKVKPKELLDSSFGINLLKDELMRIEYGVLA
jgi:putative toxin-antitoxin system antitoxin component (TIGR02293 family)